MPDFLMSPILAASPERTYILYAIMFCAIVLMTISIRRRQKLGYGNTPAPGRPAKEELAAQRAVKDDMQTLLAELQDLSRKINAQIDTKFSKLEAAIADADRRIEVLQRLSRTGVDVTVGDEARPGSPPSPADASTDDAPLSDRHAAVYQLADAGKSPVEIAQALGRTPGEIELILALRRKP